MVNCYSILVSTLHNAELMQQDMPEMHIVKLPWNLGLIPLCDELTAAIHKKYVLPEAFPSHCDHIKWMRQDYLDFMMAYNQVPIIYYEAAYHDLYEEGGHDRSLLMKNSQCISYDNGIDIKHPIGKAFNDVLKEAGFFMYDDAIMYFSSLGLNHIRLCIDFLKLEKMEMHY